MSTTFCPGLTGELIDTPAIGRWAAVTAAAVLSMPAPQVLVVQLHCLVLASIVGQVGIAGSDANELALCFNRATMRDDVRLPLIACINPSVAATIGAEKLVPKFVLI